ncbi:YadA C-terminal domain-containing protein [Stenotrophomonas rhizophila]
MEQGDAATLASANSYTDNTATQTLTRANAYTDAKLQSWNDSFDTLRDDVNARLNKQDKRLDRQGAMSSAMMNMAINAANSRSPRGRVAAGVGWQNGESALSVGYSKAIGERVSMSIGGAFSSDDSSAGIGFGVDL